MHNKKKYKYHLMSPYIFTLCVGMLIMMNAVTIPIIVLCFLEDYGACGIFLVFLDSLMYLTIILDGHEFIAYFKIEENTLALYSPGLKTWRLDLNTCTDIGIDYGTISGGIKQYWFYFSVEPVPRKYFHRINRLKYNKNCIRISYSDEHYAVMIENTSGKVRRQLENAHSVVVNAKRKGEDI